MTSFFDPARPKLAGTDDVIAYMEHNYALPGWSISIQSEDTIVLCMWLSSLAGAYAFSMHQLEIPIDDFPAVHREYLADPEKFLLEKMGWKIKEAKNYKRTSANDTLTIEDLDL